MDGSAEYQVALLIAIGSVGMLLLAVAIVLFMVFYQKKMAQEQVKRQQLELDYQTKMLRATLESQEMERRKLASDLHDSIGGMLSAIRMGISTIGRSLPNPASIDQTKKMLDDTIASVRQISRELVPATLEKFGLTQALKELCERVHDTSLVTINFHEDGRLPMMQKTEELMIFRIVQELVNNAIKHAQASQITVSVGFRNRFYVSVQDDGIGFDIDAQRNDRTPGKGLGLYSIENRAKQLGLNLVFDPPNKGSKITLVFPETHEAEA